VTKILSGIKSEKYKGEIREEIFKLVKSHGTSEYKFIIDKSRKSLESKSVVEDSKGKPIDTWKVVATVTVLVLGILAYTNREAIKNALEFSKLSKDYKQSKFRMFVSSIFTKSGREDAKNHVFDIGEKFTSEKFLREKDVLEREAVFRSARAKFNMDERRRKYRKEI
jgi:hypothetical protein